jgi:predicted RNA binding protein YcfA (HicA-like mRNA interferase family)
VKVKDVIKEIEKAGWVYSHTTGDHRIFHKTGNPKNIVIPGKPSDEISPGVLADTRRKTGLPLR